MDALTFIEKNGKTRRQPFYVVAGDEDFLKRRVLALLPGIVLGDVDPEFASTNFPGDKTDFSTVRNELDAVSFFSERRLVVIDQADPFITKNRAALEEYVDNPAEKGVLVLEAKTFPATTKLYKAIPEASLILCKAPADHKLPAWCVAWCQAQYGKKLATAASQLLVELVGTSMGILDQELHKLTDFVGALPVIEAKHVDELVGRSRGANVFGIIEAIGNAQPTTALKILTELFEQGEEPMKLMGAIGYQLRKLARVARLCLQGSDLEKAMDTAGVPAFPKARDETRKQLKHLGRQRLDTLFDMLIELDSGLKGSNPLPERLQIERLIVRLARAKVA